MKMLIASITPSNVSEECNSPCTICITENYNMILRVSVRNRHVKTLYIDADELF